MAKAAKVYSQQLREEVNAERERLGKKPIQDDDEEDGRSGGGTVEKTLTTHIWQSFLDLTEVVRKNRA